jgi:hypothetical protein
VGTKQYRVGAPCLPCIPAAWASKCVCTSGQRMATPTYERREEIELELLAFELEERRFRLLRQKVLLAVTVVLTLVTVYCALRGFPPSIPLVTGGSGVATGRGSALQHQRGKSG